MLKAMTARRGDDRGFTLVELMVVVLIIGILVAIAIPTFLNAQKTAQDTAAKANLRNAYSVAKAYQASNNGSYGTASAITGSDTSLPWGASADGKIFVTVNSATSITFKTTTAAGNEWTASDSTGALVFSCSGASCPS